jgi:MarR family transcriptional regulator, transcriptional regulator for hemolysin
MEKLNEIIFYTIDKSIRTYRIYAQKQLRMKGFKITIDQWLIIKCMLENPHVTQQEIGEIVFKDNASVTRMIELLVKSGHIIRKPHAKDRRRASLTVSVQGKKIIEDMHQVVIQNRKVALDGISPEEIQLVNQVLGKIIENCG